MKKLTLGLICLITSLAMTAPSLADCQKAQPLLQQAQAESNLPQKIKLLESAKMECQDARISFELGNAYAQAGRSEDAEQAFRDAKNLSKTPMGEAQALASICLLYDQKKPDHETAACLQEAYRLGKSEQILQRLKVVESRIISKPMTAQVITKALSFRGWRGSFEVEPSVDLRVNFDYDRSTINQTGLDQVKELGKALSDPSLAKYSFILIGHTDKRGSDAYNQTLSQQRALAVKDYLVKNFNLSADRLETLGHGRRELLFPGDSEQDHALNRRVQVKIR